MILCLEYFETFRLHIGICDVLQCFLMASLVKLLSVGGVLVVVLGWLLYEPIPEGYKKPWQVHLAYLQVSLLWKGVSIHSSFIFINVY